MMRVDNEHLILTRSARMRHNLNRATTARSISRTLYCVGVERRADKCSKTIGLVKRKWTCSIQGLNTYQTSSIYCGVWRAMLTMVSNRKTEAGS